MPVGVQCPISSSLGEFPSYWGLALVSWAFARIGVHCPSLRFPYLVFSIRSSLPLDFARIGVHCPSLRFPYLVFSIRSSLPLDFNRVSSLRPTYRHPFG